MILMRERIRKNNKIKLDKEVNQSIKWVKDIQAIELVLMQDIMNKIHLSLTNALHSLDTSSRINWDDLLNEVVRKLYLITILSELLRSLKTQTLNLILARPTIYSLLMMQTHRIIKL